MVRIQYLSNYGGTRLGLEGLKQVLSLFVLLLTLVGCRYPGQGIIPTQPVRIVTATPQAQAILIIDFGKGEVATYGAVLTKRTTAYELLVEAAQSLGYRLETESFDFGVLVKAIGEAENTDERGWLYSINGRGGKVAADEAQVNSGDQVEWQYTNF
jgi:hypothetical protein